MPPNTLKITMFFAGTASFAARLREAFDRSHAQALNAALVTPEASFLVGCG